MRGNQFTKGFFNKIHGLYDTSLFHQVKRFCSTYACMGTAWSLDKVLLQQEL